MDAILIGAGTLRADNPRLTVRGVIGDVPVLQPWRVVLTRSGALPPDAHLFTDEWCGRTLVFRSKSLRRVLAELGRRQVTSVLIEGGGGILGQALARGLVNEVHFYLTPHLAGGPVSVQAERGCKWLAPTSLREVRFLRLGPDVLLAGEVVSSPT